MKTSLRPINKRILELRHFLYWQVRIYQLFNDLMWNCYTVKINASKEIPHIAKPIASIINFVSNIGWKNISLI